VSEFRPADDREVMQLWPAVRAARLFATPDEFRAFRDAGPWRVRLTRRGDATLLDRWRAHLDVLALRGVWAPSWRIASVVADARAVAEAHGLGRVLSPLLDVGALGPYLATGMVETERIIALQAPPSHVVHAEVPDGVALRSGSAEDLPAVFRLDALCFNEFWRHTAADTTPLGVGDRLMLAVNVADEPGGPGGPSAGAQTGSAGGSETVLGYTLATKVAGTVTLARLAVAPQARRTGIASALLADAAQWAARNGADALTLTTQEANTASRALYARAGLVELSGRYAFAIDPERTGA